RDVVPLGRPDREALDVVGAPRKQLADPDERARLVFHEHRERMDHAAGTSAGSGSSYSSMSMAAAPAGIIGKHCSAGSTRASTTVVRPDASACSSADSRSSSSATVKPTPPYARASAA